LLVSLLVALTVVPTLASVMFTDKQGTGDGRRIIFKKQIWFEWIRDRYMKILKWTLRNRGKTILGVFLLIVLSIVLATQTGAEFMPDQVNPFIVMRIKLPSGTVLEETDAYIRQIEHIFAQTPDIDHFLIMAGASDDGAAQGGGGGNPQDQTEAIAYAILVDRQNRTQSYHDILESLRQQIPNIYGGEVSFANMMDMGAAAPIEVKIFGQDLEQLRLISNEIAKIMESQPELRDIQQSIGVRNPELHFRIDRDIAMQYLLTPAQIASNIRTAIHGLVIGVFRNRGEETNIRLQYRPEQRQTFEDFKEIRLASPLGFNIPLNQVVYTEIGEGPARITRQAQTRMVTITANIHGADLAGATNNLQKRLEPIKQSLPMGYNIEFGGAYEEMVQAFITLTLALLLSLILVYCVMASLFESLKQPFVIMFTFPLCLIGAAFALFLSGNTISVVSFVGLIILSGIILNNGIVLIDYVNQLRSQGIEKHQALLRAGHDRLRPVLITSMTTVIAMLPMALSKAEGSEMTNPIAWTVIGGLLSATFFTLVIIPVVYSLVDKISFKNRE